MLSSSSRWQDVFMDMQVVLCIIHRLYGADDKNLHNTVAGGFPDPSSMCCLNFFGHRFGSLDVLIRIFFLNKR